MRLARKGSAFGLGAVPAYVRSQWGETPMTDQVFDWLVDELGPTWDYLRTLAVPAPDDPRRTVSRYPHLETPEAFLAEERRVMTEKDR